MPKASDFEQEGQKLIIFEDLYEDLCDNLSMSKFFTFLSRFYLLTVLYYLMEKLFKLQKPEKALMQENSQRL